MADNWKELVQLIKSKGMTPGVSLKPGTPIEDVFPLVSQYLFLLGFFYETHSILSDFQVCIVLVALTLHLSKENTKGMLLCSSGPKSTMDKILFFTLDIF